MAGRAVRRKSRLRVIRVFGVAKSWAWQPMQVAGVPANRLPTWQEAQGRVACAPVSGKWAKAAWSNFAFRKVSCHAHLARRAKAAAA